MQSYIFFVCNGFIYMDLKKKAQTFCHRVEVFDGEPGDDGEIGSQR